MSSKLATALRLRKFADVFLIAICAALWIGAGAKPAYAYADPGSGLMAIQIVGATLAGFLFLTRKWILNMFARIGKLFGKRQSETPGSSPE
jgi:hypothetical protein